MSRLIVALVLALLPLGAAVADYAEMRELSLPAADLELLDIDAGAGSLTVIGEAGRADVLVEATITMSGSEESARRRIESNMELTLEPRGDRARLTSRFESGFLGWRRQQRIDLEVRVPERMSAVIDDGSGSIEVHNVLGDVRIDDGSGSVLVSASGGRITINDGSGSIEIDAAGGDVDIVDGSGSIDIRGVRGSVTVDDGSGGIDVSDVSEDVIVASDGSGSVRTARVSGDVIRDDE